MYTGNYQLDFALYLIGIFTLSYFVMRAFIFLSGGFQKKEYSGKYKQIMSIGFGAFILMYPLYRISLPTKGSDKYEAFLKTSCAKNMGTKILSDGKISNFERLEIQSAECYADFKKNERK